ncbi:MAG: beta-galactosidase [Oscillospiraceae bacterium]|nr:beta-galactosidase [Oscillospiraceae bacterium]
MFVFGAQYLRGFTPARDQWLRDFENMRGMGFNTVRAWLVWNAVEPREGFIDEEYLRRFLDCAKETGMGVGFLFHLHAAPEWASRKYKDYFYVDVKGRPFEPAPRLNTPSGGWPGLCPDHPQTRELEARFIRQVVASVGDRREIVFWEPMNEPHVWVDLEQNPVGVFCFCEATRAKFRLWLRRKYGSLEALNAAWGRHHNEWDEVRPPTWRMAYTDMCDFRSFHIDNIAEEVDYRASLIRSLDQRHRPVIAHAWGGGAVTCANLGAMAFDDWKNAKQVDMWGYSAFPSDDRSNAALGLGTDATRCAGQGKTIWQSELGPGDIGAGLKREGRVPPETTASWTWESIRHGAKGMLYWQYRKETHGREHATPAMTDYAGMPTDTSRAIERVCKAVTGNASLFTQSSTVPAKVALIFSVQSYLVDWCDNQNCNLSIESMSGYYRVFWERNIPVDILHEDLCSLETLAPYRLAILPTAWAITQNAREALKTYVANGGTLLSDPYCCGYTPDKQLPYEVPGSGFAEVFGAREDDMRGARGVTLACAFGGQRATLTNGWFRETFRDVTGDVLATYDDGSPMVVRNQYGKGEAILSGVCLGMAYAPKVAISEHLHGRDIAGDAGAARDFVLGIAAGKGIEPDVATNKPEAQASRLINAGDTDDLLIIISLSREPESIAVTLPDSYAWFTSILTGAEGAIEGGRFGLRLAPKESQCLRLAKKARA